MSNMQVDMEPLVCPTCKEANIPVMSITCRHSFCRGCIQLRQREKQQKQQPSLGVEQSNECGLLNCPICNAKGAFDATDTHRHVNDKACELMEVAVNMKIALSLKEEACETAVLRWKKEHVKEVRSVKKKVQEFQKQSEVYKNDLLIQKKEFQEQKTENENLRKNLKQVKKELAKSKLSAVQLKKSKLPTAQPPVAKSTAIALPPPAAEDLKVGSKIAVFWRDHDRFYNATIHQVRPNRQQCYRLMYDDGDEEWINPKKELIVVLRLANSEDDESKATDKSASSPKNKKAATRERNQKALTEGANESNANETELVRDEEEEYAYSDGMRDERDEDLGAEAVRRPKRSSSEDKALIRRSKRQRVDQNSPNSPYHEEEEEEKWQRKFLELKDYKNEHGNLACPLDSTLRNWILAQRCRYHETDRGNRQYSEEWIKQLESIGLHLNAYNSKWDVMYAELTEFKDVHKHVNVTENYALLSEWLIGQQKLFTGNVRPHTLAAQRVEKLRSLGVRFQRNFL